MKKLFLAIAVLGLSLSAYAQNLKEATAAPVVNVNVSEQTATAENCCKAAPVKECNKPCDKKCNKPCDKKCNKPCDKKCTKKCDKKKACKETNVFNGITLTEAQKESLKKALETKKNAVNKGKESYEKAKNKASEAYNKSLKKILTDDQYAQYLKNIEKRKKPQNKSNVRVSEKGSATPGNLEKGPGEKPVYNATETIIN